MYQFNICVPKNMVMKLADIKNGENGICVFSFSVFLNSNGKLIIVPMK